MRTVGIRACQQKAAFHVEPGGSRSADCGVDVPWADVFLSQPVRTILRPPSDPVWTLGAPSLQGWPSESLPEHQTDRGVRRLLVLMGFLRARPCWKAARVVD